MTPEEIRIECLKLAHRHDREPAQVVDTAKAYEDYVAGAQSKQDAKPGSNTLSLPGKKPGTR